MENMKRMEWLVNTLNKASKAYYIDNNEIMSNLEYDRLYDELTALEKESGIVLAGSPTANIGFEAVDNLSKVIHDKQLLSLDKTKSIEALKSFLGDKKGLLGWKLDGLTIVLKYENGKFIQALTRGNGEIGEDVTHNALHFGGAPREIEFKGTVILRGEAVISYSEFGRINKNLDDNLKYKNPRNLCSGTVRQLDSKILKERQVFFYAFSLDFGDTDHAFIANSKENALIWAKSQGFTPLEYKIVENTQIEEAVEWFKNNAKDNDLPSDGLVLTFDDIAYSSSLGSTSKFPKDSIAFKWEDEIAQTKLLTISWNTSRTGLINPIAIFEPVELDGTTVNRASLHNLSIVKNLELGDLDEITVYKANMIIPQVADNLTRSNTFEIPDKCEVCGFKTIIQTSNDAEFLYCKNPSCKAQLVRALTHFVSRDAMNIEGLSEATIERFVEKGFIQNYLDIFSIHTCEKEIMEMDGFGKKSVEKLINSIEKSKNSTLHNFIYALGINQIGLANAKLLCAFFDYDFANIMNAPEEKFLKIDGFGPVMAKSVTDYFNDDKNKRLAEEAYGLLNIQAPAAIISSSLGGQTFVITGSLNIFKNRGELSDYIESLGGKTASSVSAGTSFLINNDTGSNSSKNKKAKELGITIITENEFVEKYGQAT
ncbi:MAG: NAD-dependent DNA ligase LigA [Defluviitaleaceae bacterium]|nr:NAD-dependent DNA ligase LigA [Defluviitaleaceae bacterium]